MSRSRHPDTGRSRVVQVMTPKGRLMGVHGPAPSGMTCGNVSQRQAPFLVLVRSARHERQRLLGRLDGPGDQVVLADEHPHAVGKLDLEEAPLPFGAVPLDQAIH